MYIYLRIQLFTERQYSHHWQKTYNWYLNAEFSRMRAQLWTFCSVQSGVWISRLLQPASLFNKISAQSCQRHFQEFSNWIIRLTLKHSTIWSFDHVIFLTCTKPILYQLESYTEMMLIHRYYYGEPNQNLRRNSDLRLRPKSTMKHLVKLINKQVIKAIYTYMI